MNSNPSIIIMPTDTVTKKYNTRSAMANNAAAPKVTSVEPIVISHESSDDDDDYENDGCDE